MKTVLALTTVAITLCAPVGARAELTSAERSELAKLDALRTSAFLKYLSEDVVKTPSGAGAGTAVAGSPEEKALANAIEQELKRAGLTVRQEPFPVRTYTYGPVTLTAGGKAIDAVSLHAAGGTWGTRDSVPYARGNEAGGHRVHATLVDAGNGDADDYARTGGVRGKAVLVRRGGGWPTYQILEAAHQGASALLLYDYPGAREDTLKQDSMWYHEQLPTVSIAKRDAVRLQSDLSHGPVEVALENRVDSGDGVSQNVVATITGSELPDEWITATAHYDRWFHGAQDNSVGAASIVELARVFAGYRPRRSLMFIATGGEESGIEATESDWLAGSHAFATAHPDVTRRLAFEFNMDGAGWPSQKGYLHATVDNVAFQRQILADLDLAARLDIRPNISSNVDAWNLGIVGGGAAAYVTWREARPDAPDLFGPIYHTQADVYDPAHFTNLIHDLRIGALGILRMDTAIALPIALADVATWVGQSLDSDAAKVRDVSFDAAQRALAAFLREAARIDAARKGLTAPAAAEPLNRWLMRTRKDLMPWLLSRNGAGLRTTAYANELAAIAAARTAAENGNGTEAAAALGRAGSIRGGLRASPEVFRAERLYWYTSGDWSAAYEQKPRPVGVAIEGIYHRLSAGGPVAAEVQGLRQLEAEARAHLDEALFVVAGKLRTASEALREAPVVAAGSAASRP